MSLFGKKDKDVADDKKEEKKEVEKKTPAIKGAKGKKITPVKASSELAARILIEPWITEKAHEEMAANKYIFRIAGKANKKNVKKSIEQLYGVGVIKINIINIPAKKRKFGAKTGWKSGYKKAMITLKEGDKIELFEGV